MLPRRRYTGVLLATELGAAMEEGADAPSKPEDDHRTLYTLTAAMEEGADAPSKPGSTVNSFGVKVAAMEEGADAPSKRPAV